MSQSPDSSPAAHWKGTVLVFGFTSFLSAALLFLIQLIFARMILPLLGGSAAVWNTSMVFYQAVLLAAYGYGHIISKRLSLPVQIALHVVIVLAAFVVLPPALTGGWLPPHDTDPTLWVLGILAAGVGLPFFAVATTSPLLQKWFSRTRHPRAGDPYFLYAASNAGSLAGLLVYPFLIERTATLGRQAMGWTIGYGMVVAGTVLASWAALRNKSASAPAANPAGIPAIPWKRRAYWVVCAAVPSSLMLSVTTYLSSDLSAIPLLWVLPLSLYLLTFIIVFSRRASGSEDSTRRIAPLLLLAVSVAIAAGFDSPLPVMMALHLMAFFVLALVCHRRAAQDRPGPENLTVFYFCLSLGGFLGGAFNSLLAPHLFTGALEYLLMLIAAAVLITPPRVLAARPRAKRVTLGLPEMLAVIAIILWSALSRYLDSPPLRLLAAGLPLLACFILVWRGTGFALGAAAILLPSYFFTPGRDVLLHAERSYFGIHRVYQREDGFRWLIHGTTLHGVQNTALPRVPVGYYHPAGPLGSIFAAYGGTLSGPIAVAGLGTGAIAAYGKPGQELTFFEIDPSVERIARNDHYFTYLRDSPAKVNVVLGDARLSLKTAPEAHYQMIVLDAYSSDAIPVHLLTREAVRLYLRKLAPGGLLVFHISNLNFDLHPLILALTNDAGLYSLFTEDPGPQPPLASGERMASRWVAAAREVTTLAPLEKTGKWIRDSSAAPVRVWTDDYSSPIVLLNWNPHR
jgi:hypothetical protein